MNARGKDDFYVGYLDPAPAELGAWVRGRVKLLLLVAVVLGAALAALQSPFSKAFYEWGVESEIEGILDEHPVPTLIVERPDGSASRYLLAYLGKLGAAHRIEGMDGEAVRVFGTLVYRDDQTMIELADRPVIVLNEPPAPRTTEEELGVHTLVGEIVDSKCFLGVMKPGNLKPHRACATRCISGGIPPVLLTRDEGGRATYFVLVAEDGGTVNERVLDLIAEPVEITGRVVRRDDLLFLYADPGTYERVED